MMPRFKFVFALLLSLVLSSGLTACQVVDHALMGISGPMPSAEPGTQPSAEPSAEVFNYPAEVPVPFTAKDSQYLRRWDGKAYQAMYLKGINLGIGLPGTQAGDLAATREQYYHWFEQMSDLGFNNIRIYTLHYPRFYEELARFNLAHPDHPLYLFHGVWLDEDAEQKDLYDATEGFESNLREVVDAVHGHAEIGQRFGEAYGSYKSNISRWVAGWIIGREVDPEEILYTNEHHASQTRFEGKHVALTGNPSETWWTARVDSLIDYERSHYHEDRPISVSSWPTLDPLKHPTENEEETQEDVASVDFAQLEMKDMPGGYFASFHAYPYYPNFIKDDPTYQQSQDAEGVDNYLGYLKDLKQHYKDMPLIVGEYGVPSSWGDAHFSPSGMDHGGHDEREQAHDNARLSRNVREAGLAGGMLFAWIDEWWKRTWIVDEREMPRERYRLWHNLTSPEENFGMIAFDLAEPAFVTQARGSGRVRQIDTYADAAFFHLRLTLDRPLNKGEELTVGYDTYRDDLGELILPNGVQTQHRNEFALTLNGSSSAQLWVTQAYDLFGIWHGTSGPEQIYQSKATKGAPWSPERWQNGQPHTSKDGSMSFPLTIFEIGKLQIHNPEQPSSRDAVFIDGKTVTVRLPWTMLQFTDPSTLSVTNDDRQTRGRETATSEGIGISVSLGSDLLESPRYRWAPWETAPPTTERLKNGLDELKQVLHELPDTL